jgi:predicted RND superfamily exporter protein
VVNNAIILIDYSRQLERRGFRRERALLTAGRGRVRPILITAVTTILGMLPVALGKSEYVHSGPFAITVIGGLSLATLLTLVLIPPSRSGSTTLGWWRNGRGFASSGRPRGRRRAFIIHGSRFPLVRLLLVLLSGVPACAYSSGQPAAQPRGC